MSDWRISRSGYSIVTGQGDERRIIASMPVNVPKEVIQPWLEAAMDLVDLHSGMQAELSSMRTALEELGRSATSMKAITTITLKASWPGGTIAQR